MSGVLDAHGRDTGRPDKKRPRIGRGARAPREPDPHRKGGHTLILGGHICTKRPRRRSDAITEAVTLVELLGLLGTSTYSSSFNNRLHRREAQR